MAYCILQDSITLKTGKGMTIYISKYIIQMYVFIMLIPFLSQCTGSKSLEHGAFHLVRPHLGGERGGGGQVSYTFPLRITCKKGCDGVQIACKMSYVPNGRPPCILIYGPRLVVQSDVIDTYRYHDLHQCYKQIINIEMIPFVGMSSVHGCYEKDFSID